MFTYLHDSPVNNSQGHGSWKLDFASEISGRSAPNVPEDALNLRKTSLHRQFAPTSTSIGRWVLRPPNFHPLCAPFMTHTPGNHLAAQSLSHLPDAMPENVKLPNDFAFALPLMTAHPCNDYNVATMYGTRRKRSDLEHIGRSPHKVGGRPEFQKGRVFSATSILPYAKWQAAHILMELGDDVVCPQHGWGASQLVTPRWRELGDRVCPNSRLTWRAECAGGLTLCIACQS